MRGRERDGRERDGREREGRESKQKLICKEKVPSFVMRTLTALLAWQ